MRFSAAFISILLIGLCAVWSAYGIRIDPSQGVADAFGDAAVDTTDDRGHDQQRRLLDAGAAERTGADQQPRRMRTTYTRVDVTVPTNPDDHLVTELPLLDAEEFSTRHWAGLLPASDDGNKYFFYWLFAPAVDAHTEFDEDANGKVPLLIWLNGGPACSSMDGLFIENGPFRFEIDEAKDRWDLKPDPHSWHTAPAYTLYIDQPVGTGLSFSTGGKQPFPRNDQEINIDFYYFMNEFMKLHSDKFLDGESPAPGEGGPRTLNRDLFFSGESHAGHYIPSMMNYIRKKNVEINDADDKSGRIIMPLSGAAIGNGWVDPKYQYGAHDAAYGMGIIDEAQLAPLIKDDEKCRQRVLQGFYTDRTCFDLMGKITNHALGANSGYVLSSYDARNTEAKGANRSFPPNHELVESFLGGHTTPAKYAKKIPRSLYKSVLQALHAAESRDSGQIFYECTDDPYDALKHQDGLGVTPDIVELLHDTTQDKPIRLLFFNGIEDLICNHVGNEKWMLNLKWDHQDDFIRAERYGWRSSFTQRHVSGYYKSFANFAFLKLMDSGHMVPMDIPDIAKEMMQIFMSGKETFKMFPQQIATGTDIGNTCRAYEDVCAPADCNKSSEESSGSEECPTCPTCPAIPDDIKDRPPSNDTHASQQPDLTKPSTPTTTKSQEARTRPGLEFGSIVIPQSAVLVLLILSVMTTCFTLCCRRQQAPSIGSGFEKNDGGFELPNQSSYRDDVLEDEYGDI